MIAQVIGLLPLTWIEFLNHGFDSGPALAVVGICRVNQEMGVFFLSLSFSPFKEDKAKNKEVCKNLKEKLTLIDMNSIIGGIGFYSLML